MILLFIINAYKASLWFIHSFWSWAKTNLLSSIVVFLSLLFETINELLNDYVLGCAFDRSIAKWTLFVSLLHLKKAALAECVHAGHNSRRHLHHTETYGACELLWNFLFWRFNRGLWSWFLLFHNHLLELSQFFLNCIKILLIIREAKILCLDWLLLVRYWLSLMGIAPSLSRLIRLRLRIRLFLLLLLVLDI